MSGITLLGPFRQIVPMTGLPLRGALKDKQLPLLEEAGILMRDGRVERLGPYTELSREARKNTWHIHHLSGDHIALPGWVDCHTHICFGGTRAADYALRNAGHSYLEIAAAGGGIWDTVTQTRACSDTALADLLLSRAARHLADGVTTIEVKSGYGLSVSEELRLLRVIRDAGSRTGADLIPTCLAAHTLPVDFPGKAEEYLETLSRELLPAIRKEQLCTRVDAFIEESAFSAREIAPYFTAALREGFTITVHADQFSTGGSRVAVEVGAISADHLEASQDREIQMLAGSKTIATALPGASLGLGCTFTPARALLDAGAALAIASDWNPGSAPMGRLLLQACLLGAFQKLTHAEVLAGITFRAAAALGLSDRGHLGSGALADIVCFQTADYREILYHQGSMTPSSVWKRGVPIPR